MSWLNTLSALSGRNFLAEWRKSCFSCAKVQAETLQDILFNARFTEWGRKYDFSFIKNIEEFRARVPLSSWENYQSAVVRMEDGEEDILFSGRTKYFLQTSGTTSAGKSIPESELGAKAKQIVVRARQYNILDYFAVQTKVMGHTLAMSSSPVSGMTKGGIPLGFASGVTRSFSISGLKDSTAYPPVITSLASQEAVNYLIMRFALCHADLLSVSGNNAGRLAVLVNYAKEHALELIADIADGTISSRIVVPDSLRQELLKQLKPLPQRAAELKNIFLQGSEFFIPRNYWPNLQTAVFWLSGTVGKYLDDVRSILPEQIVYFDLGYGASEAKINIPYLPGTASGVLSSCTAFYEFIPESGGPIKLAHELEVGKNYEIVLTTYSGLYRYQLGDIVHVSGFLGDTPELIFLYKNGEVGNIGEEKIPASLLHELNEEYLKAGGCDLVCCQIMADEKTRRYHVFLEVKGADCSHINAAALDTYWREKIVTYNFVRSQGYLQDLTLTLMKNGWREHLYACKKGVPAAQIKLPILIKELPETEWRIN